MGLLFGITCQHYIQRPLQTLLGDKYMQGIFTKYLLVDDEEEINTNRISGFGSTGKGDNNE